MSIKQVMTVKSDDCTHATYLFVMWMFLSTVVIALCVPFYVCLIKDILSKFWYHIIVNRFWSHCRIISSRGEVLIHETSFSPLMFIWSAFTKPCTWAVMYGCVRGLIFSLTTIFYWNLKLFWQCCILWFFFYFIILIHEISSRYNIMYIKYCSSTNFSAIIWHLQEIRQYQNYMLIISQWLPSTSGQSSSLTVISWRFLNCVLSSHYISLFVFVLMCSCLSGFRFCMKHWKIGISHFPILFKTYISNLVRTTRCWNYFPSGTLKIERLESQII